MAARATADRSPSVDPLIQMTQLMPDLARFLKAFDPAVKTFTIASVSIPVVAANQRRHRNPSRDARTRRRGPGHFTRSLSSGLPAIVVGLMFVLPAQAGRSLATAAPRPSFMPEQQVQPKCHGERRTKTKRWKRGGIGEWEAAPRWDIGAPPLIQSSCSGRCG